MTTTTVETGPVMISMTSCANSSSKVGGSPLLMMTISMFLYLAQRKDQLRAEA